MVFVASVRGCAWLVVEAASLFPSFLLLYESRLRKLDRLPWESEAW